MSRFLILISLFVPATAIAYQQPSASTAKPAADAATKSPEPLVAQRQIRFETSAEDHSMTLFEADPELLQRRFVATVKVRIPRYEELSRTAPRAKMEEALVLLPHSS